MYNTKEESIVEEIKTCEGLLNVRIVKPLVLQVLAGSDKPLRRKEIIKGSWKIRFINHDLERTKPGRVRWKATVRQTQTISNLVREGLIDKVEIRTYKVNEKDLKELKILKN